MGIDVDIEVDMGVGIDIDIEVDMGVGSDVDIEVDMGVDSDVDIEVDADVAAVVVAVSLHVAAAVQAARAQPQGGVGRRRRLAGTVWLWVPMRALRGMCWRGGCVGSHLSSWKQSKPSQLHEAELHE